jgi:hypothetical protein
VEDGNVRSVMLAARRDACETRERSGPALGAQERACPEELQEVVAKTDDAPLVVDLAQARSGKRRNPIAALI